VHQVGSRDADETGKPRERRIVGLEAAVRQDVVNFESTRHELA
jgi:hypothetical protein